MSLPIGTPLPSLADATHCLEGDLNRFTDDMSQQPLIVQFWAVSCPVCKDNLSYVKGLLDTYSSHGLRLLSIHMPRSEDDTDVVRVALAIRDLELAGPCLVDNTHAIGDRFEVGGIWPTYFLFDARKRLRCRGAGPFGLRMVEGALTRLTTSSGI